MTKKELIESLANVSDDTLVVVRVNGALFAPSESHATLTLRKADLCKGCFVPCSEEYEEKITAILIT